MYNDDDSSSQGSSGERRGTSEEFIELKQFDTSREPLPEETLVVKDLNTFELQEKLLHYKRTSD